MAKKLCVRKMQTESKRNFQQLKLVQHQNTKSERKNYRKNSESERKKNYFPETRNWQQQIMSNCKSKPKPNC
jgi:hypothetical protein